MKFELTPEGGPIDTLAGLRTLIEQAEHVTANAPAGPPDPAVATDGTPPVRVKIRITPTGKIRGLVVSW